MENNTSKYCRLCADLKPANDLTNMETNLEKCKEIVDKLTRFNIHVNFNNMLPKTVCFECMNCLDSAYDFVATVALAQEAFEDYDSSLDNNEVALEDKTLDKSSKEVSSIQTKETLPNNKPEATSKVEIKTDAKSEIEKIKSTSKSEKEIDTSKEEKDASKKELVTKKAFYLTKKRKAKTKALDIASTQRKINKISSKLVLDTWSDCKWLCAYCNKDFPSPSELKIHSMQYHSTCNPYKCFDCRTQEPHIDNFITHLCKHHPVLSRICYKCSEKCKTLKELRAHKSTHQDTEYVCIGCNTYFLNTEELGEHTKTFYKDPEAASSGTFKENASLKCVLCKRTLKSKTLLNRHLLLHADGKGVHVCETCGDNFCKKKELIQHVRLHSDSRPYKCDICKFTFKMRQELKKHASVHSGPKPFACDHCSKSFRLCKELVVHSATHRDPKGYKCSDCNKSFRFRHLLVQHLRLHTGNKPYSCDICPLTFRTWLNYNNHTRDKHSADQSKKTRTSKRLYTVDSKTKEVVYPDMDKVIAWKKKIMADRQKRPKRTVKKNKTVKQAGKKSKG